jgi:transcription initiation factor TFIID subunit TAF12
LCHKDTVEEHQQQLSEEELIMEEEEEKDVASLVHSIDDPLMAFNADTARGSIRFLNEAIREIGDEIQKEWNTLLHCGANDDDDIHNSIRNNGDNNDNINHRILHLQSHDSIESSSSFPADELSLSIPTL